MTIRVRYVVLFALALLLNAQSLNDNNENVISSIIQVPRHESYDLVFTRNIGEIFIENPSVADVQVLNARKIRLFSLAVGITKVSISDRLGNKILEFKLEVTPNITEVEEILRELFPHLKIHIRAIKHVIFISGKVPTPKIASEIMKIVKAYIKENDQVINNLEISLPNQVMIKVKIAEVKRVVSQKLGIDWAMFSHNKPMDEHGNIVPSYDKGLGAAVVGTASRMDLSRVGEKTGNAFPLRDFFASGIAGGSSGSGTSGSGTAEGGSGTSSSDTAGGGGALFNLSKMKNGFSYNVSAFIDAIANESLATILAEPTLIALSGQTATFNAGGEIPYQTSYNNTSNTEFKSYGITLDVTPTIISENLINIKVKPSISDIGTSTSDIGPSIETRDASTVVELADGQSIVIAGLLKKNTSNTSAASSWLAKIPILGSLFKTTNDSNTESELVIVVTAYIVKPIKEYVPVPTDHVKIGGVARQTFFNELTRKADDDGEGDDDKRVPVTSNHEQGIVNHKNVILGG